MYPKYAKIIVVIKMAKEEKKIWIFESRKEMIISIILFIIFIIGFIVLGNKEYKFENPKEGSISKITDYEMVSNNNVFTTVNSSEAYTRARYRNVIILFGSSNNPWVGYYAKVIDEVAKEVGIKEVYYYDITNDRNSNNASYEATVNYFSDYLTYFDMNEPEIYAPLLIVKKDGILTYFSEEHAIHEGNISPEEYWNSYTTNETKEELKAVFEDYLNKGDE